MASCPNWVNIDNGQRRRHKGTKCKGRGSRKRTAGRCGMWHDGCKRCTSEAKIDGSFHLPLGCIRNSFAGVGYAATSTSASAATSAATSGCQLLFRCHNNCIVALRNYANLSELIVYGSSLPHYPLSTNKSKSHLLDAIVDQQLGNIPSQSRIRRLHKHEHLRINTQSCLRTMIGRRRGVTYVLPGGVHHPAVDDRRGMCITLEDTAKKAMKI